jgi:antitoxin (DNA-binding transcriptional repressor) of toxin-antitoxin stability system
MRTNKPMVNHIPITQARTNLGALVKRAHLKGEYFILEKDGIPIAGIMAADELEDYLDMQDPDFQRGIAESNAEIKAGRTFPAEALLGAVTKEKRQKRTTNHHRK